MKWYVLKRVTFCSILALAICDAAAAAPIARVHAVGGNLLFVPEAAADGYLLTVAGPGGRHWRRVFSSAEPIGLDQLLAGEAPVDGPYTWELRGISVPSADREQRLAAGAEDGRDTASSAVRELPAPELPAQWGAFRVVAGVVDAGGSAEVEVGAVVSRATQDDPTRDQVIPDDLIVQGSFCVGFDCVNNESFGFDTIRLKENNTRIKFEDTSASAGFPSDDWQLTANDSPSGGANKFSIEDITTATVPFTLAGGAPSHALFVDGAGRVGFRTSTPVLDLHVSTSNTPALRLEQTAAGGFTAQTWDVAGNEANFFVRDTTGGSRLPLRIRPGAPTSSIDINASGNVGIGTASPTARVDVVGEGAQILVRPSDTAPSLGRVMMRLRNNGKTRLAFENTDAGTVWTVDNSGTVFTINHFDQVADANEFKLDENGTLTLAGTLKVNGGAATFPDYVFDPGYPLLPLAELGSFVAREKHLPNVPRAADIAAAGGLIDLAEMQLRLLEKVEELTLYLLQQQAVIDAQGAELAALRAALTRSDRRP